jgi:diguanylate cyclase (GGDEF)-like protein
VRDDRESGAGDIYRDALTGLPNRAFFHMILTEALASAGRDAVMTAVLFVSFDNIKLINDTLGQRVGDRLLRVAAKGIGNCLGENEIVARPGRNEFMVLLPRIARRDDAALVAKKIFALLEVPFRVGRHELFLFASIGICVFPDCGGNALSLLKNAYTAMQRAREDGKNGYKFYTHDMNGHAFNKMMLEGNLRLALKREEFFLCYQPQIDLRTGMLSGVEALVRWNRPGVGVIYPNDFIHLMEETNLIADLGQWILRDACAQNRKWHDRGLRPVRTSVNLSASQFYQGDIAATVEGVLEETGLDPSSLELELTESVSMRDKEAAMGALKTLRAMGVHLSLDDFGTGYSALSYLRYFPINRLKIVAPFVTSAAVDTGDAAVANAIVAMAHDLHVRVVAEGVERMEDLEFICALQCDEVQGNIFSPAVSVENWPDYLFEEKIFSPFAVAA